MSNAGTFQRTPEAEAALEAEMDDIFGPRPTKQEEIQKVLDRVGVTAEQMQTKPKISARSAKRIGQLKDLGFTWTGVAFERGKSQIKEGLITGLSDEGFESVVEQIAGKQETPETASDDAAGPDWVDNLREEAKTQPAATDEPQPVRKPIDLGPVSKQMAETFVPNMGKMLEKWEVDDLGFVLPPVVKVLAEKSGLTPEGQLAILNQFRSFIITVDKWRVAEYEIRVRDENDTEGMKAAGEFYKKVRDEWNNFETRRKAVKEESLRKSQFIDAIGRFGKEQMAPILESAKAKRDLAKTVEEDRLNKLADDRIEKLRLFESTAFAHATLRGMSEEEFNAVYSNAVDSFNAKKAAERIEAERLAQVERDRIAENRRLQDERDESNRKHAEEKARADKAEADRRAAQKLIDDREEEERQAAHRREMEIQALAKAPDREKLQDLANRLEAMTMPELSTVAAQAFMTGIELELSGIIKRLRAFE